MYYTFEYSILFYSILFYSILFYSILFYSILFYSILFYSHIYHTDLAEKVEKLNKEMSLLSSSVNADDNQSNQVVVVALVEKPSKVYITIHDNTLQYITIHYNAKLC